MKRTVKLLYIIAIAAALLLAGGAVLPVAATPGVTVSIDAPDGVAPDSSFTAGISISEVTDFDACNYDITFDASVLRLDSVTTGLISSTEIPVDIWNEVSPGNYRVVQNVPGLAGVSGSGYLAELHFHVIGSAGDSSTVGPSNGVLSDIEASKIEATWVEGLVSVAAEAPQSTNPPPESAEPAPLLPPPPPDGPSGWSVLWWVIGGVVLLGIIILFLIARSRAY